MNYLDKFNNILLSQNVYDNFYKEFNGNTEFRAWLNSVLPEVELCERQQQNNPWHLYNVLGHILKSVEEVNKLTINLEPDVRKMLAYVMLFHDIGKPATHLVREKNGELIDSFFYHNKKSSEIAGARLSEFGFNSEQVKVIQKLVYNHDIFMFIKDFKTSNPHWRTLTPQVVQDEINDLNLVGNGYELMQYLIYVGKADNLAQNPKLAGESLRMLDKFQQIYEGLKK